VGAQRRFLIGHNFLTLSRPVRAACIRAFARYSGDECETAGLPPERFGVLDVAFRIAGTGSLGVFRVAVLVAGRGGRDGAWMFDLKEMDAPAGAAFETRPSEPGPERVVKGLRTLLRQPPMMLGTVRVMGHGLLVRRLTPQEDRLDWFAMPAAERAPTLGYLGAVTAAAHRRGARGKLRPFDAPDGQRILRSAVELAGLHEAVALAYASELSRDER